MRIKMAQAMHLARLASFRPTKSRLSVVTGNGDADINITSNGGVILFPMPHGNRNMHFPMMEKYWLITKNNTTFNTPTLDKCLLINHQQNVENHRWIYNGI